MAASGIGVPPVEGRWDAALWDGDPAQPIAGVWDGDPNVYLTISGHGTIKRAAAVSMVRADAKTLQRGAPPKLVRGD